MTKTVHLVLALLLSLPCSATVSLVQSTTGGSGSGTGTGSSDLVVTSSAAGFASTTGAGNFLILIEYSYQHSPASLIGISSITATTAGITWSTSGFTTSNGNGFGNTSTSNAGQVAILYSANSVSISPSATTTVSITVGGIQSGLQETVEFDLYEFSGVKTASPLDAFTYVTGTANAPSGTMTTITSGDLALFVISGDHSGTNSTATSPYTLGINAIVATIGQTEYDIGVPSGSNSASFTGSQVKWAGIIAGFKPAVAAAVVPRHRGYVF